MTSRRTKIQTWINSCDFDITTSFILMKLIISSSTQINLHDNCFNVTRYYPHCGSVDNLYSVS